MPFHAGHLFRCLVHFSLPLTPGEPIEPIEPGLAAWHMLKSYTSSHLSGIDGIINADLLQTPTYSTKPSTKL